MRRASLAILALTTAASCGRIGFDARDAGECGGTIDAGDAAAPDATLDSASGDASDEGGVTVCSELRVMVGLAGASTLAPDVVWDGSRYAVAWYDGTAVNVTQIDFAGARTGSIESPAVGAAGLALVATNDGYVVAWTEPGTGVWAREIDPLLATDPAPVRITPNIAGAIDAVSTGTQVALVWETMNLDPGLDAVTIGAGGSILSGARIAIGDIAYPSIAWDGTALWLAFARPSADGAGADLRVESRTSGLTAPGGPDVFENNMPGYAVQLDLVADATGRAVVWSENGEASLARFAGSITSMRQLWTTATSPSLPELAADGDAFVTSASFVVGDDVDIVASRLSADGTPGTGTYVVSVDRAGDDLGHELIVHDGAVAIAWRFASVDGGNEIWLTRFCLP